MKRDKNGEKMNIETWLEKVFKEFNGKELCRLLEEGNKIYYEMPSYRDLVNNEIYTTVMQQKHNIVYNKLKEINRMEREK